MSLFYSAREVRMSSFKKRKKVAAPATEAVVFQKYSCDWCSDEYESETELYVHKRTLKHREDVKKILLETSVCKMCLSKQETEENLQKHMKSAHLLSSEDSEHVNREIFVCDMCCQIYFNKQMLAIHMQHIHKVENRQTNFGKCPKCHKKIQLRHVWFHFQLHFIQSVVSCPICFKKCKNRKDLMEHVQLHPSFYHCDICGYDSKVKDHFTMHMQKHNSDLHLSSNIAIDESLLWKCFMPRKYPPVTKKSDFNFGIRGLKLMDMCICVLCRGICREDERAAHIAKYHLVDIVATKKQHMCVCGEQFFNNVLLKHHVFKLQGHHKACN